LRNANAARSATAGTPTPTPSPSAIFALGLSPASGDDDGTWEVVSGKNEVVIKVEVEVTSEVVDFGSDVEVAA
jgi:hypothetical protein